MQCCTRNVLIDVETEEKQPKSDHYVVCIREEKKYKKRKFLHLYIYRHECKILIGNIHERVSFPFGMEEKRRKKKIGKNSWSYAISWVTADTESGKPTLSICILLLNVNVYTYTPHTHACASSKWNTDQFPVCMQTLFVSVFRLFYVRLCHTPLCHTVSLFPAVLIQETYKSRYNNI